MGTFARRLVLVAALPLGGACASAAPSRFEPGEYVWSEPRQDYVPASFYVRSESERRYVPASDAAAPSVFFCPECKGFYSGEESEHRHWCQAQDERSTADVNPDPLPSPDELGSDSDLITTNSSGSIRIDPEPLFRFVRERRRTILSVLVGAFALLAAVLLLAPLAGAALRRRRASARRVWRWRNGAPVGLELLPGRLVCSPEGVFDGGTANGYAAMFRDGDRWTPAFVKRAMRGRSIRADRLFPALRFEADVLRRMEGSEAVPRLLVPPQEAVSAGGEAWSFYAMSVATGTPWPDRGGLGRDTRPALHALCEALERMHDRGIGHHDLKPQNIHWDARRKVVTLLDLGSAIDHTGTLRNPLGETYPKSEPWVAPERDGRRLSDLSTAADAWVYGLLFCEALTGGIHPTDAARRRWPEREADREWLRQRIGAETSAAVADAVVDGLFAPAAADRMALRDFRRLLEREWEEDV